MHARARRIKRQHGLSLIVIDYLQLMSEGGDNRNNELSNITRKLKLMAKDLNVPVICLSQLSRKVEERADKRPMMSDLRDSGAIEQDADLIVMMYREEYYNKETTNKGIAEANIVKQRMGEVGTVLLTFQGEYSRFSNFSGQYHKPEPNRISRGFDDGKSRAGGN
jgi:replicative DNA helicase